MTRTQIGNVITEANGDELTVYLHRYGDEEPDEIEIDGKAAMLTFDPTTAAGRAQVRALIDRLDQALTTHGTAVEQLYGTLNVGDHCSQIRLARTGEKRCPHAAALTGVNGLVRCARPAHEDLHHVAVDDSYDVIAVRHATDYILPANAPWAVC